MIDLRAASQIAALHTALSALQAGVTKGRLEVVDPSGRRHMFEGRLPGPVAKIVINDARAVTAVLARADIGLGQSYAEGWWETPDLVALCTLIVMNTDSLGALSWGSGVFQFAASLKNRIFRRNSMRGARDNIMAHYDLGNAFYKLWLDESLSYSGAIYESPGTTLGRAQQTKYARILDLISPKRRRILEIGCGWGGFIEAAGKREHHVTALTISPEQYAIARMRSPRTSDVRLEDYRKTSGRFDAIVSIEMFEAVGERYWPAYFKTLEARLADKGTAVVQTITIRDELFPVYRRTSDYIRACVFPGGMLPSPERFCAEARRNGLVCRDAFAFGGGYARTLLDWLARFDAAKAGIEALGYDDRFIRGWRFYLALCAGAFASGRTDVYQFELARA